MIHRDPARAWTVGSLAAEVAMSRSAFAARFTELVQEPAMQYVTRWRMQIAVNELKEDGAAVGELASRLGYQSEAAFSRAFKRTIGVPPGAITRNDTPMTFREPENVPTHRAIPPGVQLMKASNS
jgi:AraC-like DNA-binding protein